MIDGSAGDRQGARTPAAAASSTDDCPRARAPRPRRPADQPAHNCAQGLKCHPLWFKCYADPPEYDQPCEDKCAEGLSCDKTIGTCVRLAPLRGSCHPYGAACQAGLECDATIRQCYHSPRCAPALGGPGALARAQPNHAPRTPRLLLPLRKRSPKPFPLPQGSGASPAGAFSGTPPAPRA